MGHCGAANYLAAQALPAAALKPLASASATDMYSPFLVLPKYLVPAQRYTLDLLAVFTHTWPGAAAVVVVVVTVVAAGAGAGAAGLVTVVVVVVVALAAGATLAAAEAGAVATAGAAKAETANRLSAAQTILDFMRNILIKRNNIKQATPQQGVNPYNLSSPPIANSRLILKQAPKSRKTTLPLNVRAV